MVPSELQHPGIFFGRLSQNRNVVEIFPEDRVVSFGNLVDLVAFHDLLDLLKTPSAERGRDQSKSCRTLSGIQFCEADAGPVNERYREVGPACPLLFVVKCEEHSLPLLLIERRKKNV